MKKRSHGWKTYAEFLSVLLWANDANYLHGKRNMLSLFRARLLTSNTKQIKTQTKISYTLKNYDENELDYYFLLYCHSFSTMCWKTKTFSLTIPTSIVEVTFYFVSFRFFLPSLISMFAPQKYVINSITVFPPFKDIHSNGEQSFPFFAYCRAKNVIRFQCLNGNEPDLTGR